MRWDRRDLVGFLETMQLLALIYLYNELNDDNSENCGINVFLRADFKQSVTVNDDDLIYLEYMLLNL